jgi:uncharacterized protein involved in outer membrane biogenesis
VLNRLYIVVGVLAILALGAAFIVPSFIPWGDYRERLAEIAGEVLGAPVRIEGDIHFSLLPQPRLQFAGVSAGPPDAPNLTVESVEAEFSLIDFIRDRYTLTRLALTGPHVEVNVGSDSSVDTGMALPQSVSTSNISVANATISRGEVRISDNRSGEAYLATGITGEIKLEALRGPFSFAGSGTVGGESYGLRLTTGLLADDGTATLSASLRPIDDRYSLSVEGTLKAGLLPTFSGTMAYRQKPPKPAEGEKDDIGRGDFLVTSRVEASPAKVLLGDYTVIPDENRAATRLLGAADLTLGTNMRFNAVISGGLMALPPRDATAEQAVEPYELVRLLRELPIPAAPALKGTVGIDIAELDLRAFSLRNVRLDASARDGGWDVQAFTGDLPGETKVRLAGRVTTDTGHTEFSGAVSVATPRLDALSTLWRKPADGNPLFNMPGAIEARADLVGETLSLSDGRLTIDGEARSFSAQLGVGATRDIHLTADLGALDAGRSAALFALLPDPRQDQAFGVTFPSGEFDLVAARLTVDGLPGRDLVARGSWDGGVLVLDRLSAADLGGASFEASLTAFGSFDKPELSGTGKLKVESTGAPAAARFFDAVEAPLALRAGLSASFPAELNLKLGAPTGEGAQTLDATGTLGSSTLEAKADIESGFLRSLEGRFKLVLDLTTADPATMTAQLGLGDISLFPEGQPMHLAGVIEGDVGSSLVATVRADGGGDSLGFSGNVVVTDPDEVTGKGMLKATLADPSVLANRLGVDGLSLPPVVATATLEFAGAQSISLSDIQGSSNGGSFSGQLAFIKQAETGQVGGKLTIAATDVAGLVQTLVGPAALLSTGGIWPDGPFATGMAPRTTSGRVDVDIPSISLGDRSITDASFDLDWDPTSARLRDFSGKLGAGSVSLELAVCCAGPLSDKQVNGRIGLTQVALDDIAPPAVAGMLDGTINASGRFDATAGSVSGILGSLTGEGTYTVDGLTILRLAPEAIAEISELDTILEQQPDQLTALIEDRLDDAAFGAPQVTGSFTVAGGVLRSPNLTVTGATGGMFGSAQLRLADLGLTGSYSVTPTTVAPAGLMDANPGQITVNLGGTLLAPAVTYDVSGLVDAIMVKAYEAEVARLEQLRAEDEARKQAEDEAQAAEEAAAKKAAEDAAVLKAADEAATRKAAEEAAARQKAEEEAEKRAQAEALRRAQEEASKPLDLFGN